MTRGFVSGFVRGSSGPLRRLAPLLGALMLLPGCDGDTGPSASASFDFDFRTAEEAWTGDFVDFREGRDEDVGFEAGLRPLPDPLEGNALFHRGNNISDDLFMYFKRRVNGLDPGATYRARFRVEIASDVGQDCTVGAGPAILIKAGAATIEPRRVVEGGFVRLNVDKGNQRNSGENGLLLGDWRNGEPGCGEEVPFATKTLGGEETITVRADGTGAIWLLLGSESTFEVAHELHFPAFRVELERVTG